ncbi:40s ribosomal protein s5-1 [Hordeum vulgare]|nr:40s ribosomal protein s5-1 [Hordeum vulgare]
METRLEAMKQQVFKCQGMVEHGLNANHMMITEFTNKHKIDANDIGKHLSRLYDRIDHLQAQIYDPQNQKCEWLRLVWLSVNQCHVQDFIPRLPFVKLIWLQRFKRVHYLFVHPLQCHDFAQVV